MIDGTRGCDLPWVRLAIDGEAWDVAASYVAPVGIAEARDLARELGCVLPTCRMAAAIWAAADLKIEPLTRNPADTRQDLPEAAKLAIWADQDRRIQEAIAGRPYTLLGGSHKDVCAEGGIVGLYGWFRLDGRPWQPWYTRHVLTHRDYSQGLRLIRRAPP